MGIKKEKRYDHIASLIESVRVSRQATYDACGDDKDKKRAARENLVSYGDIARTLDVSVNFATAISKGYVALPEARTSKLAHVLDMPTADVERCRLMDIRDELAAQLSVIDEKLSNLGEGKPADIMPALFDSVEIPVTGSAWGIVSHLFEDGAEFGNCKVDQRKAGRGSTFWAEMTKEEAASLLLEMQMLLKEKPASEVRALKPVTVRIEQILAMRA